MADSKDYDLSRAPWWLSRGQRPRPTDEEIAARQDEAGEEGIIVSPKIATRRRPPPPIAAPGSLKPLKS